MTDSTECKLCGKDTTHKDLWNDFCNFDCRIRFTIQDELKKQGLITD